MECLGELYFSLSWGLLVLLWALYSLLRLWIIVLISLEIQERDGLPFITLVGMHWSVS